MDDFEKALGWEEFCDRLHVLTDKQKVVILLYYIGGLTLRRIAEIEGVSFQAVDDRLRNGLAKLRYEILEKSTLDK